VGQRQLNKAEAAALHKRQRALCAHTSQVLFQLASADGAFDWRKAKDTARDLVDGLRTDRERAYRAKSAYAKARRILLLDKTEPD
jgi:hypothetical protein